MSAGARIQPPGRNHRLAPEERHPYQHQLIADRKEAWLVQPRRSERRRQAEKRAWHTLKGHLYAQHGLGDKGPAGFPHLLGKTYAEVEAIHDAKHAEQDQ